MLGLLAFSFPLAVPPSGGLPALRLLGSDEIPVLVPGPNRTTLPFRDLPAIANFVGSVGTAVQGTAATAGLFTVSAFTAPPLLACGEPGCGRVWIDGVEPRVASTRWLPYEARRSAECTSGGVSASSQLRMQFERPLVMWELQLNMTAAGDGDAPTVNVTVEWAAAATTALPGSYIGWATKLPGVLPQGFTATEGPVLGGAQTVLTGPARSAAAPHVAVGQAPAYTLFALFDGQSGDNPTWTFPPQQGTGDIGQTSSRSSHLHAIRVPVLQRQRAVAVRRLAKSAGDDLRRG